MRVALCLSGHFRNFDSHWHLLKKNVIDIHKPDVFGFAWSESFGMFMHVFDKNHPSWNLGYNPNSTALPKEYPATVASKLNPKILRTLDQNTLNNHFEQMAEQYKPWKHCWEWTRPKSTFQMLYAKQQCIYLKQHYERVHEFKYDKVIFTRWDVVHEATIPQAALESNNLVIPTKYSYYGPCDVWGIGSSEQIDVFASLYDCINEVMHVPGFTTHSHQWLHNQLTYYGVPYEAMEVPISLCNRL